MSMTDTLGAARKFFLTTIILSTAAVRAAEPVADAKVPRVAAIATVYYHNSHADVIVSRLLKGHLLNGEGEFPRLKLASLFIDRDERKDVGRPLMREHNVPVFGTIREALTLGTDKLAVDGVLVIAEHGDYPPAPDGQLQYPKRKFFNEIVQVFETSGRSVPIYNDKHLADTWEDAKWIYDASVRLKFPMMAGSSLPMAWRYPAIEPPPGEPLKEILVSNYGPLEAYGFHALEFLQALVEKRRGAELGVKSVTWREKDAAWRFLRGPEMDQELLPALLKSLRDRPWPAGKTPEEVTTMPPVLWTIEYRDGFKAHVFTLDWHLAEWAAAWRQGEERHVVATVNWTQEWRPLMHFTYLLKGVEQMMSTGKPAWPVERTLLTTGTLDALFAAQKDGTPLETPHLDVKYTTEWKFQQPPPPPPNRPLDGQ